jgi:hypothetical protein
MNHFIEDGAMKTRMWISKIVYGALGVCLLSSTMHGAVLWNGILIAANVTNQNIIVSGNNTIATQVLVTANDGGTHTVTANSGNPTQIKSIANPGNLAFRAANGSTIVFNISNTTDFNLTSNNTVTQPFLITFETDGTGQFIMNIDGGSSITLTGDPTNPALVGTDMFVIMNGAQVNPFIIVRRDTAGAPQPNVNAAINILNNSLFSFLAPTSVASGAATEVATVQIDASNAIANAGTIELVLSGSSSGFIIDGELTNVASAPTFTDIDLSTPAGLLATLNLINSKSGTGGWSGFQVRDSVSVFGQLLIQNGACPTNFPAYTGARSGFILGAQGNITIGNLSYMLFLDGSVNGAFVPPTPLACGTDTCCIANLLQLYKDRNPGALIIDGNTNVNAGVAAINLQGESLLAFASTANCCGATILDPSPPTPFTLATVDNSLDPRGSGAIVFDVEGPLNVTGVAATTGLELLSLNVTLTGGPALINGSSTVFPLRDYALDSNGNYLMYGNASWMVNNIMNLFTTNIKWTFFDVTSTSVGVTSNGKRIYQNNQPSQSEPGIISGERQYITSLNQPQIDPLCGGVNVIQYFNSNLLLHTSLALNVDQAIPNQLAGNTSSFVFYTNGYCLDEGTGRQLILGTDVGALASDGAHVIYHNSQLNLFQTTSQVAASPEVLNWTTGLNNQYVTQGLNSATITGQTSVHTVNLAHESNISIGTNLTAGTPPFSLVTFPTLNINNNYINITSQGGRLFQPGLSNATGEAGVFVDSNGIINIGANVLFAYGAMITKSGNGVINLPRNQALPLSTVGIAQWQLNLADPTQVIVVAAGQHLANFTIDWENTTKKFCAGSGNYVPYFKPINGASPCPVLAGTTPVIPANIAPLPTVQGRVDQIQIKQSRVGDPAQLIVDGGIVDEVLYFNGITDPGIAPVGTIIIRNDGIAGLGTASRNIDSLQASIVLGVNGVTILADGNGTVRLNEDVLVNNLCSFLTGPNFGASGLQQLTIESDVPREIRVKSDGILDLTQFTNLNKRLTFAGQVRLVLEPGATVVLGGGSLYFIGNSSLYLEPFIDQDLTAGTTLASTDSMRVKFLGSGQVTIQESAVMSVPRGSFIGIETDTCLFGAQTSAQSWRVADSGQLNIGDNETYGGVFQVGNTIAKGGTTISFTLILEGQDALVQVNSQGFLGLGMGMAFNQPGVVMNSRLVGKTYNVAAISIVDTEGTFEHSTIFPGTSTQAGLIAFGPDPAFTFQFDKNNGEVLGGGNIIALNTTNTGLFNPVVLTSATVPQIPTPATLKPIPLVVNPATQIHTTDNLAQPVTYSANILSSQTILLLDSSKTSGATPNPVVVAGTPLQVFLYLAMLPYNLQSTKMVTVTSSELGRDLIGFVYTNPNNNAIEIWRQNATRFLSGGVDVGSDQALQIGTAGASITGYPPAASLSIIR